MYKTIATLALAASLFSLPAFAQQSTPQHGAHHPETAQTEAPAVQPPGSGGSMGKGMESGMSQGQGQGQGLGQGQAGDMGQGMMNCPMMMGGMQAGGMHAQGMHGSGMQASGMHGAAMPMAGPMGDQSVASVALNAVNEKMHREMAIAFTGNVDADFVTAMIVHHQGAIDMAKVVKAFGEDAQIRELADAIIDAQEGEISMMQEWLARNANQ